LGANAAFLLKQRGAVLAGADPAAPPGARRREALLLATAAGVLFGVSDVAIKTSRMPTGRWTGC
jgi:hypothetical protein